MTATADKNTSHDDACIADQAFGDRIRGYIDSEVGEDHRFMWGLVDLDESDLLHIREAVQRYFRYVAAQQVGDAFDISWHASKVQRVAEIVAAIEVVEKARGEATAKQTKWRQAERTRKYHAEQAAMREKARLGVSGSSVTDEGEK